MRIILPHVKKVLRAAAFGGLLCAVNGASAVVFQAEDFTNAFDTTTGNTGGAYRTGNVDIQATTDTNGGHNVGWIAATEWLSYANLSVPTTGTYTIRARVASAVGGTLSLDLNGGAIPLGTLNVPATGGWQTWQTVEKQVQLTAGTYSLGVYATTGNWNFNWIEVIPAQPPVTGHHFEAEAYASASDNTPGNTGGKHRTGDVDIEATSDTGGGFNVGWMDSGEWLSFNNMNIATAGNYKIEARVASGGTGGIVSFDLNGGSVSLGQLTVPATGGWQTWKTVTLNVNLPAGNHSFGVYVTTGGWNLNWVKVTPGGSGPVDPDPIVTWSDEFNSINTAVWNFETGGNGWGNNELQYYSNGTNASIQFDPQANSNVLVLEARKETGGACWWGGNCGYTSTRMNTRHKMSFKYGRMEARLKLPRTQGIWPAFWMLGDNFNTQGWPQGGELDIMEHVGTNNITSGALHGPGYSGNTPITGHLNHGTSIDSVYKVYAVEWDANGIRWYADGVNFYSVTRAQVEQYGEWVYDQPFWFLLNIAVGGNWPGDPDHANFTTQRMYVDYIRVYQ
ncbi:MAG: carbohydrate-binding protein [Cellvibrio sp.]|uniref:carbohydrate-binding protein n=1 Tax=Cellvibrio sp. TaxID=1965322 RepID=UPI00272051D4|nr:carbohydrate-binding protein [Cellvibrio sp.]